MLLPQMTIRLYILNRILISQFDLSKKIILFALFGILQINIDGPRWIDLDVDVKLFVDHFHKVNSIGLKHRTKNLIYNNSHLDASFNVKRVYVLFESTHILFHKSHINYVYYFN